MNISRCALGHALVLLALLGVLAEATERCQTLSTNVFVTKEKTYEYNGRRVRLLCAGNLDVTKCEGACLSQVSPSVVHFPGFKKECKCCRESKLVDRLVTLSDCFDGNTKVPDQWINIYIKEPTECACYDCAL